MKRIILVGLIMFLFVGVAYADMYLIYDKDSKFVHTMCPRNDTVIPDNHELTILDGSWKNYNLTGNITSYQYIDGELVKNLDKAAEITAAIVSHNERIVEMKQIENKMRLFALQELKKESKVFKHVKESDFGN